MWCGQSAYRVKLLRWFGLCFAVVVLLFAMGWGGLRWWSYGSVSLPQPVVVKVAPEVPLSELTRELRAARVINNAALFSFWVRTQQIFHKIQAGTYRFSEGVSPRQLLDTLLNGANRQTVIHTLVIPEGYSLKQVSSLMAEQGLGEVEALLLLAANPEFLAELKVEAPSLEGFLHPATYAFYEDHPNPREVFATMVAEFYRRLPPNFRERLQPFQLGFYQAVIFASLIEKETDLAEERAKIAEVIWRRLKANIPLAIDAAVIYGSSDYQGSLKTFHLKDRNNLYNTRIHRGLPPTPIATPTTASLAAVVSPSDEGYLYYVVLSGAGGKHHFAKTLKEHNLYVRKFIRDQAREK